MKTFKDFLEIEEKKEYYKKLQDFLDEAYNQRTIFPPRHQIFAAFDHTPFEKVKVVILGQDPYHGINQANGLAFSVQKEQKIPPSLKNMYTELCDDLGCSIPKHGDLTYWANEGVLLLNTVLSVEAHQANSHAKKGWEIFTQNVIEYLNQNYDSIVYILWGGQAQKKVKLIDQNKNFIITSPHPSPLSCYRGFYGSKPYSKTNEYLIQNGLEPIDWVIKDV